ncbi:hypothetical protein HMPREF1139_0355 [Campylobacter sp. FOBRC14]|nr:hypothetical protein HMPREF1139_0355 [Campylobacter sp. FOBRC14]
MTKSNEFITAPKIQLQNFKPKIINLSSILTKIWLLRSLLKQSCIK